MKKEFQMLLSVGGESLSAAIKENPQKWNNDKVIQAVTVIIAVAFGISFAVQLYEWQKKLSKKLSSINFFRRIRMGKKHD